MLIIGLCLIGLVIIMSATKLALVLHLIAGNDVVIQLRTSDEALTLERGTTGDVTLTASATTNPFCKAHCTATFGKSGTPSSTELFTLRPTSPFRNTYTIPSSERTGQQFYTFSLSCQSVQTALCHTKGIPTERHLLITVETTLTEAEQEQEREMKQQLEAAHEQLQLINPESLRETYETLTQYVILEELFTAASTAHAEQAQQLTHLTNEFHEQRYATVPTIDARAYQALQLNTTLATYHELRTKLLAIRAQLADTPPLTANALLVVTPVVTAYNNAVTVFNTRTTLAEKEAAIDAIPTLSYGATLRNDILTYELHLDMFKDALCTLGECYPRPSSHDRVAQDVFNLTCESFPAGNTTDDARTLVQYVTNMYLETLPDGQNTELIKGILLRAPANSTNTTKEALYGLTPSCPLRTYDMQLATPAPSIKHTPPSHTAVQLADPSPQCCALGACNPCCTNCSHEVIVFLHGHAFNKETSAEYSLDGFNKLQARMEADGYLNAGAISLYTALDTPASSWGRAPVPLTLRASYYFDLFKEPENYIIVQTKSENIDTYAIRLKELIDTIHYKTGRQRVTLIAHSMGGLVARRYLQIFGEDDVKQLIMIGTPNNGIVGNIAEYCPWVGEQLECRDMQKDSLFLNKLNRGTRPTIPVHVIAGTGCMSKFGVGDGVVLQENVLLDWATNYIVPGTCTDFKKPLHVALLDIDTHPEVYTHITNAIAS